MNRWQTLAGLVAALIAVPAAAQLLPGLPGVGLPDVGLPTEPLRQTVEDVTEPIARTATRLLEERTDRLTRLVRRNRETIELDIRGEPARRGELLVLDPSAAQLAQIRAAGLGVAESEQLETLGITVVRLTLPRGMSLAEGQRLEESGLQHAEQRGIRANSNGERQQRGECECGTQAQRPQGLLELACQNEHGVPGVRVGVRCVYALRQVADLLSCCG